MSVFSRLFGIGRAVSRWLFRITVGIVIGIDHNFLDFRVSRIRSHERCAGKEYRKRDNNADRHIEYTERVGQERAEYDTEKGEDVALDSENRKENGVLYQLRKTKVKGYLMR